MVCAISRADACDVFLCVVMKVEVPCKLPENSLSFKRVYFQPGAWKTGYMSEQIQNLWNIIEKRVFSLVCKECGAF